MHSAPLAVVRVAIQMRNHRNVEQNSGEREE
jgi:hypothetical protein